MYALSEEMEMKARISTLARKVEELERKRLHEVQAVNENPVQANPCTNHPNLSWKPNPPAYVPPGAKPQFGSQSQPQPPPSSSPVEQAILNLSKVVGNFVEEQKGINVQLA